MNKSYNHLQIERIIEVLGSPKERASKYLIENPEDKTMSNLYNELRLYKEALLIINEKSKLNVDLHWNSFERKITLQRKMSLQSKKIVFWKIAATILVLLTVGLLLYNQTKLVDRDYDQKAEFISIGSPKAILTTAEGTRIHLTDKESPAIRARYKNVLISKDSSTLQYIPQSNFLKSDPQEIEYHIIEVPRYSEWKLVLPDGTKVWLNADSKFKYPVSFVETERKVFLIGEAYFEVAQDSNKPFLVNTEKIDTKVLGTEFNVSAYPNEDVNITLAKGSIFLKNKLSNASVILQPNDNAELKVNETNINLSKVEASKYGAWKNGYYYFERATLDDILKKLQKWYDFQVFYENPMTKYYEFRMRADRKLSFGQIIKRLEETERVKIDIVKNTIVISDVKRE